MERASRLIVISSTVAAGAVHAWLASGRPWLVSAAAIAFLVTALIARVSMVAAVTIAVAATYVAPALTLVGFGVSDYHTTLVWLAALAGAILARADLARWHLPQRWRLPFVAWALILAIAWPIVAGRELDFSLIAARTYDTFNAAFEAPPRLAAAWIVIVALSQLIGILWLDLLWARFSGANLPDAERFIMLPLVASALVGALAGIYQGLVDPDWLSVFIWSRNGRAGGLMLDANTFGIGAAIWAPASVALAWRLGRGAGVAAAGYLLLSAAVWYSGSRTGLLVLTIGTAGVAVAIAERRRLWQPRMAPIVLLVGTAILVIIGVTVPRTDVGGPLRRVVDRLPRLEAGEVRRFADEMFWDRFGYGQAAAAIIADHPVTGVGPGAFHIVGTDYLYRADSVHRRKEARPVPDNAQNWWRHELAELGLAGSLPLLWISILVFGVAWRGGAAIEPAGVTTILRTILIGVGLASLFGVPTQHPATWLSFATILFWLTALYAGGAGVQTSTPSRTGWIAAFGLAAIAAIGLAITAADDLRVPARALRTELAYSYGVSPSEGPSEFGDFRWTATRAVAVIPVPNRWLKLTVWAPHSDVAANPVRAEIALNRGRPVEHVFRSRESETFYLEMPANSRWALIEVTASRELQRDRALQVASMWLRELPRDVADERVVR